MAGPVLVDSSVWIDHIRLGDPDLTVLLRDDRVLMHPMVYGEIALGSLKNRSAILTEMRELPQISVVTHAAVAALVEWQELFGKGIGLVDAHLLAATREREGATLFTRDRRLRTEAERLGLAYAS